jgi:DNA repair protein RadD
MKLRDYQQAAVDAVVKYWERGGLHPLVEVPTGGGKSAILGALARVVVQDCGGRVVIATHRAELIDQDAAACRRVWPQAPVGIYSAALGQRRVSDITVCGVASVAKRADVLGRVDVLIVDEAHLIPAEGDGQYQTLVRGLREANPALRIVGLTATPYRLSQGYLTQNSGALFTSICYRVDVASLIAQGHLAPLVTGAVGAQIDTDALAVRAGEFAARDLELAADVASVTEHVADDVAAALQAGRTSALLFGVGVAHAHHLAEAVRDRGVSCEVIVGETEQMVRQAIIGRFRRRELQAIASCDVLTTGFDAPVVDTLAVVRPTCSASLWVQMVGRGMRPAEGKSDCLVLDYGGNIARHGPVDDVRIKERKGEGGGDAPVKTCPNCCAQCPAGARTCSECDAEFPPPEKKANARASDLPVLSTGSIDGTKTTETVHDVAEVAFVRHDKRGGGTPSLRVDYYAPAASASAIPTKIASEWICIEHEGFAHAKACGWWARNVNTRMPDTVDEAVERLRAGEMRRAEAIKTKPDGDFTRVVGLLLARGREPGEDDDVTEAPTTAPVDPFDGIDDLPF